MTDVAAKPPIAPPDDDRAPQGGAVVPHKAEFDDVMLAMDVVDTLRRRTVMVERELASEEREAELIGRLREIYAAQGIEVPDRVLRDGVKALGEKRFVYEPKTHGLQGRLARIYVARDRWLRPVAMIAGVAAFLGASYEFGFDAPRERAAERAAYELSEVLPSALADARDAALALVADDAGAARRRIEAAYQDGAAAAASGNRRTADEALSSLRAFQGDLARDLTIRVVSRPGERSGIFRIPEDAPTQRNYYLVVEAVDASGAARPLEIASEEDQSRARVAKWGVRVPEAVYNRIAADKQDDQIIQNATLGRKPAGRLAPEYDLPDAGGFGGSILEW